MELFYNWNEDSRKDLISISRGDLVLQVMSLFGQSLKYQRIWDNGEIYESHQLTRVFGPRSDNAQAKYIGGSRRELRANELHKTVLPTLDLDQKNFIWKNCNCEISWIVETEYQAYDKIHWNDIKISVGDCKILCFSSGMMDWKNHTESHQKPT